MLCGGAIVAGGGRPRRPLPRSKPRSRSRRGRPFSRRLAPPRRGQKVCICCVCRPPKNKKYNPPWGRLRSAAGRGSGSATSAAAAAHAHAPLPAAAAAAPKSPSPPAPPLRYAKCCGCPSSWSAGSVFWLLVVARSAGGVVDGLGVVAAYWLGRGLDGHLRGRGKGLSRRRKSGRALLAACSPSGV